MENQNKSETSKSIFRNVLYSLSTWIVSLVLSFYATRIIVKNLGDKDYGIYLLVLGFISYSFNFNFGRAITKYIAEYRASGANEKIKDVISATLIINLVVGIIGVSAIFLSANWLVVNVYELDAADQSKSILALYLAAGIVFFLMLTQTFSAVLQGIHRFDVYSNIFNLNSVVMVLGNIFLALSGYGLLSLLVWNLAVTFLTLIPFAFGAKRFLPEFGFHFKFKADIFKLILTYTSGIIGYQILANLLLLFERGWVTRQFGAGNLTYYTIPMLLSFYIQAFIGSLVLVVFPLASELKDQHEKLLLLYQKATKIVCLLVFFMATSLIVESHLFLSLWMGAEFADKTYFLLIIHTISFSLLAIQTISWQMTEGLGYPGYNLLIFLICLVINVTLMVWLTPEYGLNGVAFGRLAGFGTMFFAIFYVEKWFLKSVQLRFWLKLTAILGVASVTAAVIEQLIISNLARNWLTLIAATGIGGIFYCLILLSLGLITADEKVLARKLLRQKKA